MSVYFKYSGKKVASAYKIVTEPPLSVAAGAVYKYTTKLEKLFTFSSRFEEQPYPIFKIIGEGKSKRILLPREVCAASAVDNKVRGIPVSYVSNFKARNDEQVRVVKEATKLLQENHCFIIQASTGFGKTIVAMQLIANVGKKVAIVVTKEDIKDQWVKAAKLFLNLKDKDIGFVQGTKCQVKGKKFVVFMIHSISKIGKYHQSVFNDFGLVIYDEIHRLAANHFSNAAWLFPAKLRLGLSASPYRKDGKEKVFKYHIGPVLVKSEVMALIPKVYRQKSMWKCPQTQIKDKNTGKYTLGPVPHSPGRTMHINKMLASHKERNLMIARFIHKAWSLDRNTIVFSDLKIHLERLEVECIRYGIFPEDIGYYIGGLSNKQREEAKTKKIILSTYSFASEATDIPWLDTLVLATPRADVLQIVGRIQREFEHKKDPVVYDVLDEGSNVFLGYANKRNAWYKKIGAEVIDVKIG